MSNLIRRLEKLESSVPDIDTVINVIIRAIVGKDGKADELNYLVARDGKSIYERDITEDEDSFIDRASSEYRSKINASERDVLLFTAYQVKEGGNFA